MKNLAILKGRPLIYYAIKAAKDAGIFNRIIINSEHLIFKKIAQRYSVEFYQRPNALAASFTKSDSVVYDFIKNNPCDILAWVNPTSPLQSAGEIRRVIAYFLQKKLDSLVTVANEQVHCLYRGKPVNFKIKSPFAQTQELFGVQRFVYSLMVWRADVFMRSFKKNKYGILCGKVGYFPVSKPTSLIIKRKDDLMLADYALRSISKYKNHEVNYDKIIDNLKKD